MRLNYTFFTVAKVRFVLFGISFGVNFEVYIGTGERKGEFPKKVTSCFKLQVELMKLEGM